MFAATSHNAGTEHAGAENGVIQSGCACPRDISINIPAENRPRLVIVGGGFAGLYLARNLRKAGLQIVLWFGSSFKERNGKIGSCTACLPDRSLICFFFGGVVSLREIHSSDSCSEPGMH